MRLIDADTLIQKLHEMKAEEEQYIGLENDVSVMIGSIGFEVMNMPTAYDIDNVRTDAIEDCISIVDGYLVDMPITHDNIINALCKLKKPKGE